MHESNAVHARFQHVLEKVLWLVVFCCDVIKGFSMCFIKCCDWSDFTKTSCKASACVSQRAMIGEISLWRHFMRCKTIDAVTSSDPDSGGGVRTLSPITWIPILYRSASAPKSMFSYFFHSVLPVLIVISILWWWLLCCHSCKGTCPCYLSVY